MADITSIPFAFHGFLPEQEAILSSYFANADKWDPPWVLTEKIEDARIIIAYLASKEDYDQIEALKRDLTKSEVIVFSVEKPPQAQWHLERLPSGKVPIVAFSKLVLKISHALKRKKTGIVVAKTETSDALTAEQPVSNQTAVTSLQEQNQTEQEELAEEPADMSSFFNQLDSLLDSKPNEKRKRFNEK